MNITERFQTIRSALQRIEPESTPTSGISYDFTWRADPVDHWAWFSPDDLIALTEASADFDNVSQEDRRKIFVHFGDHETELNLCDADTAHVVHPTFDSKSIINPLHVYINRSLEIIKSYYAPFRFTPDRPYEIYRNTVWYPSLYPWEWIAATIREEINHADILLKLKFESKIKKARERYKSYSQGFIHGEGYSKDILEVTAGRQRMRFLEGLALQFGYPERALFFREMYEYALKTRMNISESPELIMDQTFVPTGWRP